MSLPRSLPRNGEYELFTSAGNIYCFDDKSFKPIQDDDVIHQWIRQQPTNLWRDLKFPFHNVYYLQPELYTWFKIRWSSCVIN